MRLSRVQFTVRRMMITIALVCLLLGIFSHRERRIRKLDQLVTDQELFVLTAEANVGNYADWLDAPTAALAVIKQIQALEKRVAATRASQVAGVLDPLEKTRISIDVEIERARGQERIKKMILEYEKAYLKNLERERANVW